MNYEDAVTYMQNLHRYGIKLGNERFEALLHRIGNPHEQYGIVHVAGTKGKGSTTVMAAQMLMAHGYHVGSYFSPYVFDLRERVQVDGEMIPTDAFARIVTELTPHIDALSQTELGQTTEFELKTAVGFLYYAQRNVDFAAIEVGMGGRLDATNVVNPLVSVITNIDLDHTHILGDTHAKIAYEKAGIIKPSVATVTATDEPHALRVIQQTARDREAPLYQVSQGGEDIVPAPNQITWFERDGLLVVRTPNAEYSGLRLGLLGAYQRINAACAVAAIELAAQARSFTVDPDAVREGLRRAYLPGRFQVVRNNPMVVMDGAHNRLAAQALAAEVRKLPHNRLLLVAGMIEGHEPSTVLDVLAPLADRVYATQPTWMRGLDAEQIAAAARRQCADVQVITHPLEAARAALVEADEHDLVLITGSFYTVGDVDPNALESY